MPDQTDRIKEYISNKIWGEIIESNVDSWRDEMIKFVNDKDFQRLMARKLIDEGVIGIDKNCLMAILKLIPIEDFYALNVASSIIPKNSKKLLKVK